MKYIIVGQIFAFLETWYFGWNWTPSCVAERWCDIIATALVFFGFGIIYQKRNEKMNKV